MTNEPLPPGGMFSTARAEAARKAAEDAAAEGDATDDATAAAAEETEADADDGDEDEAEGPPPHAALKEEWVDYAVEQGADREEAEAMTKADLIEEYGA